MTTPAEDHRQIAATFTERVNGVTADGWDAVAPVDDWTARDVVGHLIEWLPSVLGFGPGEIGSVQSDPVAAWGAHRDWVQGLLDDPATRDRTVSNPHFGERPIDEVIASIYTPDVFLHTWDLARATGQDDRLDPERCAAGLAGAQAIEESMRSSGQFGPAVPVPDDAPVQDRLIGFIGRDPRWQPN